MSQTVSSASSGTVESVNALQRIISSPRPMPSALRSPAIKICAEHHLAWEGCQGPAIAVLSQDVRNDAAGAGVNV